MIVATYNVNHVCNGSSAATARVIATSGADVVCLQEVNRDWQDYLTQQKEVVETYLHMNFHSEPYNPWAGFACLSKHPIESFEVIKETERGWYPAGRVLIQWPNDTNKATLLQILVVHLRAPVVFTRERNWWGSHADWIGGYFSKQVKAKRLDEIQTFTSQLDTSLPTVVLGDFNEQRSGGCIKYLLERGYANAAKSRWFNTWTWSFGLFGIPLLAFEYDYIFYSQHLESENGAVVGSCGGSDHKIVAAAFALRNE